MELYDCYILYDNYNLLHGFLENYFDCSVALSGGQIPHNIFHGSAQYQSAQTLTSTRATFMPLVSHSRLTVLFFSKHKKMTGAILHLRYRLA